jgi:hypothetical protein
MVTSRMINRELRVLALIWIAAGMWPTPLWSQARVRLLRPGTFFIDPPPIRRSEQWLGLRRAENGWELVPVLPRVSVKEPTVGDRASRITVDVPGEVLFLISGVRGLTPGPVATAVGAPRFLYPGESVSLGQRQRDGHVLEALGAAVHEIGGPMLTNYVFWMRHGQASQAVARFERNSPDHGRRLIWSGDLDRDLRPDLLFDFPLGDVGENYVLFLSSAAAEGKFVARVASFATPGC